MREVKKGHARFTVEEDNQVRRAVDELGTDKWAAIAARLPGRSVRQVKDRWNTYLSDSVKALPWTAAEDALLIAKHREMGPRWVRISECFVGRSDVAVKNRFSQISRRVRRDCDVARELFEKQPALLMALTARLQRDGAMELMKPTPIPAPAVALPVVDKVNRTAEWEDPAWIEVRPLVDYGW
jgi:hypothetical protein